MLESVLFGNLEAGWVNHLEKRSDLREQNGHHHQCDETWYVEYTQLWYEAAVTHTQLLKTCESKMSPLTSPARSTVLRQSSCYYLI